EAHETTLPPGGSPHPPHRHAHSEMWLIREGTVDITVNNNTTRLGPGSLGFVSSNDEHGIKNAGETPASYFVVAIGPGASCPKRRSQRPRIQVQGRTRQKAGSSKT